MWLGLLFVVLVTACAGGPPASIHYSAEGVSFEYPRSWVVSEGINMLHSDIVAFVGTVGVEQPCVADGTTCNLKPFVLEPNSAMMTISVVGSMVADTLGEFAPGQPITLDGRDATYAIRPGDPRTASSEIHVWTIHWQGPNFIQMVGEVRGPDKQSLIDQMEAIAYSFRLDP